MGHRGGGVVDLVIAVGRNILSRYLTLIHFLNISGGGGC